jgi:hypothetical protein
MKKSTWIFGALVAVAIVGSMFAPAMTRTVQAEKSNACPGLQNAFDNCMKNGNPTQCVALREQLAAHGCQSSSGSSSSASGGF